MFVCVCVCPQKATLSFKPLNHVTESVNRMFFYHNVNFNEYTKETGRVMLRSTISRTYFFDNNTSCDENSSP